MINQVAGTGGSVELATSPHAGAQRPTPFRDLGASIAACKTELRRQVGDHPARTVAMAVGAGYLLGGGLYSRLTGRLLGTGARLAFRMVAVPLAVEVAVAAVASALADRGCAKDTVSTGCATEARRA